MVFPRQEYWSRLPFPSSGDLPDPGIELTSTVLAGRFFTIEPRGKSFTINFHIIFYYCTYQNFIFSPILFDSVVIHYTSNYAVKPQIHSY